MVGLTLLYLFLQAVDLIVTYAWGVGAEANPLAVSVWQSYGYLPLVAVKVIIPVVLYGLGKLIKRRYPDILWGWWVTAFVALFIQGLTVAIWGGTICAGYLWFWLS
jgi:hypothetical protein